MSTGTESHILAARGTQGGQAALEAAIITLVVIAGVWGVGWLQGEGGVLALLIDGLHRWHHRFASLLALPL